MRPFEKCLFDVFNKASVSYSNNPMDISPMSPMFVAWTEIANYSSENGEFELSHYFNKLYPELDNTTGDQKRRAKKHIYQYHVRYDFFAPRMLLDFFQMDVKIEQTKYNFLTRFRNESNYWVRKSAESVESPEEFLRKEMFKVKSMVPGKFALTDACTNCYGLGDLRKCSIRLNCDILYCSQRCHQLAWPNHRNRCPGGGWKTAPPLSDGNGNSIHCEQIKRDYLCDPTKNYELFSGFVESGDQEKENTKPVENAKNVKFETSSVKNKNAGKKKRKKRK